MLELNLHLKGRIRPRKGRWNNENIGPDAGHGQGERKMIYAFRMNYRLLSEESIGREGTVKALPPHAVFCASSK